MGVLEKAGQRLRGSGHVLVVDDEAMYRQLLLTRLERKGYSLAEAADGETALAAARRSDVDVALVDVKMPGIDGIEVLRQLKALDPHTEVIVVTGHGSIDTAISAMKAGAYDYLSKPYKLSELDMMVGRALEKRRLALRCAGLAAEVEHLRGRSGGEVVGVSRAWRRTMAMVRKVAALDLPVLIQGESGTGKEVVASALHSWSPRKAAPLVPLNCALLQENLLESELFGHRKGAFTGADRDHDGLFQTAADGTLFLDEIGELKPESQAKLLRVLETGEFRPLGAKTNKHTDARVIAATNRDLAKQVKDGRFREDLFYRLNVVAIEVPSLRERREDIPVLATHFLNLCQRIPDAPTRISKEAMEGLTDYTWPGNVRELRNVIECLCALTDSASIEAPMVADILGGRQPSDHANRGRADDGFRSMVPLAELERSYVGWVLEQCGGNVSAAARRLGIARSTVYRITGETEG